jgi:hypothetical protein
MTAGRRWKAIVGGLLASAVLALVAAILFEVFGSALGVFASNRSTDTDSRSLPDAASKLAFLERYMTLMSPVDATEFHIVFHDNDWAPSDWDMRVALKVKPSEVARWTAGMTPRSDAGDFGWIPNLVPASAVWSTNSRPDHYERAGCTLRVHAAEGVLFKVCSTLRLR